MGRTFAREDRPYETAGMHEGRLRPPRCRPHVRWPTATLHLCSRATWPEGSLAKGCCKHSVVPAEMARVAGVGIVNFDGSGDEL